MARPHPVLVDLAAGRTPAAGAASGPGLLPSALEHGMQGLLWTHVRAVEPGFPERSRLAGVDAATRQRHLRLWETLGTVRRRLEAAGVEIVAVKGVTAEARWYTRAGERPSTDVDVLVAPDAVGHAGAVLRALDPDHPLGDSLTDLVRAGGVQSADLHIDGVAVDLHFDLLKLGYPMRAPEAVWAQTRALELPDGGTVRVLAPEIALVHFLVHANKDSFPRLLGYADVVRIARAGDLDWDLVGRTVRDEGLQDVVGCAWGTVTRALEVEAGGLAVPSTLRSRVWHAVWPDRITLLGATGTSRSRRQEVVPFLVRGRGADAIRAAARVVLPARAAVAARYADIPGGYLTRLARGRSRSMLKRRADLRSRDERSEPPSGIDGRTKAALLRDRLAVAPLWLDVSGRSMARSIPSGARVRVVAAERPGRGEVWAFCLPGGAVVVHRARGTGPRGHRFQGDGCIRPDPPIDASLLVGRVVEVTPARAGVRWGPAAGAVQRAPRVAVARGVHAWRRVRGTHGA